MVYDVFENENTRVTLNIGLTNKTTDYYAASYGVQTGFDNISNIAVKDGSGEITYYAKKSDNGTEISFDFNEKTVGKGETQKFSISFDTPEITKNFGTVWEVNIPGISNQSQYKSFNVRVNAPKSIGIPSIIKPAVGSFNSKDNSLYFTRDDLGNGGISIAYGTSQAYKFDLSYHIQNKNVFPETTEIALPSNNSYQTVILNELTPNPINVVIDRDGNWLARYKLLPSQKLNIVAKGFAKISYHPKNEELSAENKAMYLRADQYWEVNDPQIQKLAKELKTPRAIQEYVVENLKYDTKRVDEVQKRAGARGVLLNKASAVCLEFTDLFVTLARAAGIPARAIEGYANTSNNADRPLSLVEDVLHAWPQYYDEQKKAWIMVDPTWENTTKGIDYFNVLDFDHFAFVVKGEDSDYPIPAGGYKTFREREKKDVKIETTDSFPDEDPSVTVLTQFPEKFYGGLPLKGELIISNTSKVLVKGQPFKVEVQGLSPKSQNFVFSDIAPFGKQNIPVKFHSPGLLTNETFIVKITIGKDQVSKEVIVEPFYKNTYFLFGAGGLIIGTFLLILSLFIYRSRRLHFPK